ncbi:hypothetical protein C882_2680 [Caenispirillum salinarum AK4]|uniref:Uncharacterized protein n=1 Tax=Caenispirillum salinarum AK4 TaxID=1238182 RepID=K9HWP8_9PROT|nr:hypothetical protein [Caenispirillum salinarum]EKV32601.1 hypothetical protein C882_2680 [Caenispirillum salinarum AK4]
MPAEDARSPAMTAALDLVDEHDTWQALRAALEREGLASAIGSAGIEDILRAWQARAAWRMDDAQLKVELSHWADGLGYAEHLDGFNAISPRALVDEAERRGWFVRRLGPAKALVNPPDGRPLAIPFPAG